MPDNSASTNAPIKPGGAAEALRAQAIAAGRSRDWPRAIGLWRRLLADTPQPESAELFASLATASRKAGELSAAEDWALRGLQAFPDAPRLLLEAAEVAARRKDWPVATRRWSAVLAVAPSVRGYTGLAQSLARNDRLNDAADAIRDGLAAFPQHPAMLAEDAMFQRRRGDWPALVAGLMTLKAKFGTLEAPAFLELVEGLNRLADGDAARTVAAEGSARYPEHWALSRANAVMDDLPATMKRLTDALAAVIGSDCVVFGSGPDPDLGDIHADTPIVCCNGSSLSLDSLSARTAAVSVVHSHVLLRETPSDREARQAFIDAPPARSLIVLTSPQWDRDGHRLPEAGEKAFGLPWELRHHVIAAVLGAPMPFLDISTGAFAAVAAFFAGARSVRLVGMSLNRQGHSYNQQARYRNHVSSDAALYASLAARGLLISSPDPLLSAICASRLG